MNVGWKGVFGVKSPMKKTWECFLVMLKKTWECFPVIFCRFNILTNLTCFADKKGGVWVLIFIGYICLYDLCLLDTPFNHWLVGGWWLVLYHSGNPWKGSWLWNFTSSSRVPTWTTQPTSDPCEPRSRWRGHQYSWDGADTTKRPGPEV